MTIALEDYGPPMTESRQWVTRTHAAEMLGVTTQTVDRYAREGRLARYKVGTGRFTRYRIEDVEELRRALTEVRPDER